MNSIDTTLDIYFSDGYNNDKINDDDFLNIHAKYNFYNNIKNNNNNIIIRLHNNLFNQMTLTI